MSDNDHPEKKLPLKAGAVFAQLEAGDRLSDHSNSILQQKFYGEAAQSESDWAHLKGLKDHYWHKGNWSWFLMFLLVSVVGFQSFLLFKVGSGSWSFEAYKWLVPLLLLQNLGQIIALAIIVVKSLFRY